MSQSNDKETIDWNRFNFMASLIFLIFIHFMIGIIYLKKGYIDFLTTPLRLFIFFEYILCVYSFSSMKSPSKTTTSRRTNKGKR